MMVKICGITERDDALAAMYAGAAALGFNFYPKSPRYISPRDAADLVSSIPSNAWFVGVFVGEPKERIEEIALEVGLDVAQLHGGEQPEDYPGALRVWRAVRAARNFRVQDWDEDPAEALLVDGPASGRTFEWGLARQSRKRIILAGGLDAGNVRQAIEAAHPWGVDACSRLERAPGRKDRDKMNAFIKAALAVNT